MTLKSIKNDPIKKSVLKNDQKTFFVILVNIYILSLFTVKKIWKIIKNKFKSKI